MTRFIRTIPAAPPPSRDAADHWTSRAACVGLDPELFFPNRGETTRNLLQIREAKQVCKGCPVKVQCLAESIHPDTRSEFGIFGGLDEEERAHLTTPSVVLNVPTTCARADCGRTFTPTRNGQRLYCCTECQAAQRADDTRERNRKGAA